MERALISVRTILILSLAICLSITTVGLAFEDVSSIAKEILPGTVLIQTYDMSGRALGQGSGFFVSEKGDIVTCYHVLKGYSSANVTTLDKKEYRVKNITAINKTNDLIKISLSTTDHDFNSLKLNTTPFEVGQEIIVIGGPLGLENTVSNGIISAIRDNRTQITAPVSPGSSGGPVVNMKGEVIGIVAAQMKVGQNLNFAIPSYLISTMQPASAGQVEELITPDYSIKMNDPDVPLWKKLGYASEEDLMKGFYTIHSPTMAYSSECYKRFLITEKFDDAVLCYDCILKMNPSYAPSWNSKGVALYQLTRYEEALFCFNKSLELDPTRKVYLQNKGAALQKLHREDEAKAVFAKAKEFTGYQAEGENIISELADGRAAIYGAIKHIG